MPAAPEPGAGGVDAAPSATVGDPARREFADYELAVGAALELRRVGLDESRYPTELIGYVRNVSLMVKMPAVDGKLVLVREGQPVVMRAFSGTEALSFPTTVIAARFSPEAYLHLQYPKAIESTTIRKQRRIEVDLIAASSSDGSKPRPAIVLDLSATGARLAVPEPLGDVGSRAHITFRLQTASGAATLDLDALVCNVKHDASQNRYLHGVKFVHVEPLHALALRGYIASARRRKDAGVIR